MTGRALFTSIPKCGKNLATVLFDALDVARIDQPDEQGAGAHVMARWTQSACGAGRSLQPGLSAAVLDAYVSDTEASMLAFRERLRSIPTGHYIHAHIGFDTGLLAAATTAGVPVVFLYRDPRAMLASQAHFLMERGEPSDMLPRLTSRSLASAYELLIGGDETTLPAEETFAAYAGWLSAPGVLAVRFEDLVGPRGGGSAGVQLATVARIAQHIGWSGPTATVVDAAESVFNPGSGTFRRGSIEGWREDVPTEIIERYPAFFVGLARRWGYAQADGQSAPSVLDAAIASEGSASMRSALARTLADGDERLALIHRLQAEMHSSTTERDRLSGEGDERLKHIRDLQDRLATTAAERDRLGSETEDRLAQIFRLQSILETVQTERDRLGRESDERLALVRRLETQRAEIARERDRLSEDGDQRLAVIRRLEALIHAREIDRGSASPNVT